VSAPANHFETMQAPVFWFLTASKLAESAEVLVSHNSSRISEVQAARSEAVKQAIAKSVQENNFGLAKIEAQPLNYVPAYLLYGYALENLFKGIVVANNTALISNTKLSSELTRHDLSYLAEKADVSLSPGERKTCDRLTAIVVWAGRYPAPTKADGYPAAELPSITMPTEMFLNQHEDLENIRAVLASATASLKSRLSLSLPTSDVVSVWKE
jgi:hypothetical protein